MSFIDGTLLAKARVGDRDSIIELCEYLAACFKEKTDADPWAMELLSEVLDKIGGGQSPDEAFGWKQARRGRRNQNTAFQEWDIKMTVQARMRQGESWRAACTAVSSDSNGEFIRSAKTIEKICVGLTTETDLLFPEDIFPLGENQNSHRRIDRRNG